jgi:hypothetical protein
MVALPACVSKQWKVKRLAVHWSDYNGVISHGRKVHVLEGEEDCGGGSGGGSGGGLTALQEFCRRRCLRHESGEMEASRDSFSVGLVRGETIKSNHISRQTTSRYAFQDGKKNQLDKNRVY